MTITKLISWLIGASLLAIVLYSIDTEELRSYFYSGNMYVIILTIPVMFGNMALRTLRWRVLYSQSTQNPRLRSLFSALMSGYLANNLLPARAGDFVRAYLLGKQEEISKSEALATIMVERVLDLVFACLVLAVASIAVTMPVWLSRGGVMLGLVALAGLLVMVILGAQRSRFLDLLSVLSKNVPEWFLVRLQAVGEGFLSGLNELRAPRVAAAFAVITLALWVTEILVFWLVAIGFSFNLSLADSWIIVVFAAFGSLVPALPAQIGAFEFGALTGLSAIGKSGPAAGLVVLTWHVLLIAVSSSVGAICLATSGESILGLRRITGAWTK